MKLPEHIRLTPRELDVLRLMLTAAPQKEIAATLGISVETVKTFVTRIFDKTGHSTTLELMAFFHGLERAELEAEIERLKDRVENVPLSWQQRERLNKVSVELLALAQQCREAAAP